MDQPIKQCYRCGRRGGLFQRRNEKLDLCLTCYGFAQNIYRKYNLSLDDYSLMLETQEHKCKLCGAHESVSKLPGPGRRFGLVIDHCHSTNKVRSLLCHACNTGLGAFKDNVGLLAKGILYLTDHN